MLNLKLVALGFSLILILLLGWAKAADPPPTVVCAAKEVDLQNKTVDDIVVLGATVPEREEGADGCSVGNSYGVWNDRRPCTAAAVAYPSSEAELQAVVGAAARARLKMKVATRWSHSIPKWACPGGAGGGLVISTLNYTRNLAVDAAAMRITADSGVTMGRLLEAAAAHGLALPHSPYWLGVTLGGLLSTGSHGSSLFGKGSAVHEYVTRMTLVVPASPEEGYAKVVTLTEADEDLKAAKVSLGVLGVISQVTLQLQPMFKRSITNLVQNDTLLEDNILSFATTHEYSDITWHPSQYEVIYRQDDRVPVDTLGDGVNDFIGFRPQPPSVLNAIRDIEVMFEKTRNSKAKCLEARAQIAAILKLGTGLKNDNKSFTAYPVVGFQHKMQASGSCLSEASSDRVCGWDPSVNGLFFYESAFLIGLDRIRDFIQDVKRLRGINPTRLCGTDMYNGLLFRFVKKSDAYLGAMEDSVEVNFNYYRARAGDKARLDMDIWEEMEQMARYKYNGLPSWAKNRDPMFDGVSSLFQERAIKFKEVMARLDSESLFSSEWSDRVLGIAPPILGLSNAAQELHKPRMHTCELLPHEYESQRHTCDLLPHPSPSPTPLYLGLSCALDGMCICSHDLHCDPQQGYYCMPGLIYKDAHVCRYQPHGNH